MARSTTLSQLRASVAGDASSSCSKSTKKSARFACAALATQGLIRTALVFGAASSLLLAPSAAIAVTIAVNGSDWEVKTVTGSWGLDGTNVGGQDLTKTPWYGSSYWAENSAAVVDDAFGKPNGGIYGAYFAYESGLLFPNPALWRDAQNCRTRNSLTNDCIYVKLYLDADAPYTYYYMPMAAAAIASYTYAYAVPVGTAGGLDNSSSVPGPLPILGLAAAFGFSRKLRKRIKLHKDTSSVSTSPGS